MKNLSMRQLWNLIAASGAYLLGLKTADDPDLFWHLAAGEFIANHGIVHQDPGFSFTVAELDATTDPAVPGQWVTHEWLTEVLMYRIYDTFGPTGLSVFFALLIVLVGVLIYNAIGFAARGTRWHGPAIFVGMIALLLTVPSTGPRPQVFNLVFGAVTILLAERHLYLMRSSSSASDPEDGSVSGSDGVAGGGSGGQSGGSGMIARAGWLWLMVPMMVLWVNMHGGFLFGFAIAGVYVLGGMIEAAAQGKLAQKGPHFTSMIVVGVVSLLATLINPNTYKMWIYAFETLGSSAMREFIVEWHSPDFHNQFNWVFLLLTAFGFTMAGRNRASATDWLFLIGTSFAGFQSSRNIQLFALCCACVIAKLLAKQLSPANSGEVSATATATATTTAADAGETGAGEAAKAGRGAKDSKLDTVLRPVLAVAVVAMAVGFSFRTASEQTENLSEKYPVAAVDWIRENLGQEPRIFNEYGWGGYLIYEGIPVYIDGRADLYGDEFFYFYDQAHIPNKDWREPLDRFDIEATLVRPNGAMPVVLEEAPDWKLAYEDDVAVIYTRN